MKYKRITVKKGKEKVLEEGELKDVENPEQAIEIMNKNKKTVGTYVIVSF